MDTILDKARSHLLGQVTENADQRRRLCKYNDPQFLGDGATGTVVFRVGSEAVKIGVNEKYDAFSNEWSLLVELQHENIVKVVSAPKLEFDLAYMRLELVEGLDLLDLLRQTFDENSEQTLSSEGKRHIATSVLKALVYLHSKGIVHRDLKCENILIGCKYASAVDARTPVKLCDLGLSHHQSEDFVHSGGSPITASPEAISWSRFRITDRSDVFSYAAMLYSMYTTRHSLPRSLAEDTSTYPDDWKTLCSSVKRSRELPTSLVPVLGKCLRWRPSRRPSALELSRAAFFQSAEGK